MLQTLSCLQAKLENLVSRCQAGSEAELIDNVLLAVDHLDQAIVENVRKQANTGLKSSSDQKNVLVRDLLDARFIVLLFTFALAQSLFIASLVK